MEPISFEKEKQDGTYKVEEHDFEYWSLKVRNGEKTILMTQANHRVGPAIKATSYRIRSKNVTVQAYEEFWSFSEAVDSFLKIKDFFSLE
ncbi:hypothetical protein ACT5AG_002614 [Cronobacter sakazakii]